MSDDFVTIYLDGEPTEVPASSVQQFDPPPPNPLPRSVPMWRARTVMKLTPHGGGSLYDTVKAAVASLEDSTQRIIAGEALDGGGEFSRDGVFVPILTGIVGVTEAELDGLMALAVELPA